MKAFFKILHLFCKKPGNYISVPSDDKKALGKADDERNSLPTPRSASENSQDKNLKDSSTELQQNSSPVCYANDPELRDEYKN